MKSALTTVLITLLTLEAVQASSDIYKKVGDTVVLSPGSVDAPITSITWKHNSNLAAEWYRDGVDFYSTFEGRSTLNTTTGELTISGLTLKDSGSYTAEINNRVLNPTEILVISEVPTPTVSESCDAEKSHCVLTCEGITTDSGPVTYTWRSGDVMKSKTKELNITKEEKSSFFRCKMENPFSTKSSKQVVNPVLISNTDNPDFHKEVGDKVVLSVHSIPSKVTSIVWKHGSNDAVKWDRGEPVFYGDFKGRCKLNTRTGDLTISNLTPKDSGSYTVEINGDAIKTTKIKVISAVPTPTISKSCDAEMTRCVFTCEVNTAGAEPVTYGWTLGDKVLWDQTKELNITKNAIEDSISCMVKNPVSSESSKVVPNPFKNKLAWLAVLIPVVACVVGGGFLYKHKRKGKKVNSNFADKDEDIPFDLRSHQSFDENNHTAEQTPTVSPESKEPVDEESKLAAANDKVEFSNEDQKTPEDNDVTKM